MSRMWQTGLVLAWSLLAPSAAWINSGTPAGVPEEADCAFRRMTYAQGRHLLPERGSFRSLFEALQLQNCGAETPVDVDAWQAPSLPIATANVVYADSAAGSDANEGSLAAPLRSLEAAVKAAAALAAAKNEAVTVALRRGTYHLNETLQLSAERFPRGVHIVNHAGERAVLSGGQPLPLTKSDWVPVRNESGWRLYEGWNNVFGAAPKPGKDSECCTDLGAQASAAACGRAASRAENASRRFSSFVWSSREHSCFGVRYPNGFRPVRQQGFVTGRKMATNLWRASLAPLLRKASPELLKVLQGDEGFPGLRKDGRRAIRAKYPDGDPEQTGSLLFGAGQSMGGGDYVDAFIKDGVTKWTGPRSPATAPQTARSAAHDWPGVEWPMTTPSGATTWSGMGNKGTFYIGYGGSCSDLSPAAGYWCGTKIPRGQSLVHASPSGVEEASKVLPHFRNYSSTKSVKPVVNAWRGGGRWFTWQFLVDSVDAAKDSLSFSAERGGNQGGEGNHGGGQWWIENVLEECDAPNEFFYDAQERALYFSFNGTEPPTGAEQWVVPVLPVLVNVSSSDSSVSGLEIRDARITYLEPHGAPSGGDWALERFGAVFVTRARNVTVRENLLTQLDGNGIFLDGAVRNARLLHNELSLIGASAMAAWGYTSDCLNADCSRKLPEGTRAGPDGREMQVPWGTRVERNLVREIGLWQKQSSMWFQALTAESVVLNNVHFNGPRAGMNFNDGFGGGDLVAGNLLANCVRESGDHGPVNTWDRVPYITTLRTGKPSILPKVRHFQRNLWFGTYATQSGVDNDDGSSFYRTEQNVFVYGAMGLKSDFGGRHNEHVGNVYLFVSNCFAGPSAGTGEEDAFTDNLCHLGLGGRYLSDCGHGPYGFQVHGNQIYTQSGDIKVCGGRSLNDYVKTSGRDKGSSVAAWPRTAELVAASERLLQGGGEVAIVV